MGPELILLDFVHQISGNYGSVAYIGSCRTFYSELQFFRRSLALAGVPRGAFLEPVSQCLLVALV